jgi:hypothetical protein
MDERGDQIDWACRVDMGREIRAAWGYVEYVRVIQAITAWCLHYYVQPGWKSSAIGEAVQIHAWCEVVEVVGSVD